jgi:hypothetical protein
MLWNFTRICCPLARVRPIQKKPRSKPKGKSKRSRNRAAIFREVFVLRGTRGNVAQGNCGKHEYAGGQRYVELVASTRPTSRSLYESDERARAR